MGLWAGIKHALNSTLGTEDFKPLDKFIIEQKKLVASDDIYLELEDFSVSTVYNGNQVSAYYPKKIKMIGDGSMRIKGVLTPSSNSTARRSIVVYLNEQEVYFAEWGPSSTTTQAFQKDISYKNKDVISFLINVANTVSSSNVTATVENFSINGKVIHNVFELIEE